MPCNPKGWRRLKGRYGNVVQTIPVHKGRVVYLQHWRETPRRKDDLRGLVTYGPHQVDLTPAQARKLAANLIAAADALQDAQL